MSNDLEEMFAEASAEADDVVDESPADNLDEPDEVTEEPDEVEDIEPEIETEEPEDNTEEVPDESDVEMETIIIDGEEVRVTKQELRDGYLRRADYSKKTAEAAAVKRKADWADQVQSEFERDAEATIMALAEAYKIPLGQSAAKNPNQPDPYEDMDPDVAIVLKRMEEQEARHQAELRRIEQQTENLARKAMIEEVKFELDAVKADFEAEFGEPIDEEKLLEVAMAYNLPLIQAADLIGGQIAKQQKKTQTAAAQKAAKAAEARKTVKSSQTAEAKRVASGTLKGSSAGDASSDVSVDDFNNIEDLFELLGA